MACSACRNRPRICESKSTSRILSGSDIARFSQPKSCHSLSFLAFVMQEIPASVQRQHHDLQARFLDCLRASARLCPATATIAFAIHHNP
jgi:hypothetical protein